MSSLYFIFLSLLFCFLINILASSLQNKITYMWRIDYFITGLSVKLYSHLMVKVCTMLIFIKMYIIIKPALFRYLLGIVFTAWPYTGRKLGIKFCLNRPSCLFYCDLKDKASVPVLLQSSCHDTYPQEAAKIYSQRSPTVWVYIYI